MNTCVGVFLEERGRAGVGNGGQVIRIWRALECHGLLTLCRRRPEGGKKGSAEK